MRMVLMETMDGETVFPIIVADTVADYLNRMCADEDNRRPTSYDLMEGLMKAGGFCMKEVFIYRLVEGVFYTRLQCVSEERELALAARVSDAVILAIRNHCPIYIDAETLERVGVSSGKLKFSTSEVDEGDDFSDPDAVQSLESLECKLHEAIEKEDYETASMLRDRINGLKGNS